MKHLLSRRYVLTGAVSALATASFADAPLVSLRPTARPGAPAETPIPPIRPQARLSARELIARAGLGGTVGFVVADTQTGEILEEVDGDIAVPPASVTKAVTALYALEALGPDYRFETRVLADGPIVNGVLQGNLILAGGGDPHLVTDQLATLVDQLKNAGLKEVTGEFRIWGDAIARVDEIDDTQLDYLGYNPTVAGLNLNFNRVHFEWKRAGENYTVALDARSETHRPPVTTARMRIVDRTTPVYTYADSNGVDNWTVARRALGSGGSRWLPVRYPALYAGEVFQTFARTAGIVLPKPVLMTQIPQGDVITAFKSDPLREILRDMLRFSTNLTAEVTGLAATAARADQKRGLRTSAFGMTRWAADRAEIDPQFVDHSGLGDQSRIAAGDMVRLLNARDVARQLKPILKPIAMLDDDRERIRDFPATINAKTGTLNFVSSLAGYITTQGGRELAFAFFAADMDAREKGKLSADEQPPGAGSYNGKAKRLQQVLLQRWGRAADL
ncbi:D-alanyl-D-alanine carboxypeptidase / D-alanyl-D-alanine-endopeptidase (penicillin-binding protein 4) [Cognatiyoonia koreensis]|uniref:D-alanyl-D-alanine carboxypeptidase / D-alanyl-D-alanine-endopeptidase (Penicillin-binding protein 4) n=1 Tax=Cognatiyoonia koreensis TaxID=364200 RepID=A0A1I0MTZ6_9RHOB|nr:D-alanyl-D-alanine carboxypeptidase/D-alanyl-D-alanine-endopeptidase [Cognatiyoonia koreensis]SEV92228.1 D-alanyl-D-alanine carboxypeptidase / D-alanyl-D-alanine-endopeptidase (penicillin-binding protein 4) [Cognatiyoonia koreensis]